MTIYDYLWTGFILVGFVGLLVYLLARRQMPGPPSERKWYGDEEEDDTHQ